MTWKQYLVIIFAIFFLLFVGTNRESLISRKIIRNWAMYLYTRQFVGQTIDNGQIIRLLENQAELNVNDWLLYAHLAKLYTLQEEFDFAFVYATSAANIVKADNCQENNFLRSINRPLNYFPNKLLAFDHPQTIWNFVQNNHTTGNLKFYRDLSSHSCIASITANFDQNPNQFTILSQKIVVKPQQTYHLSARIRFDGNFVAWIGVQSLWKGSYVPISKKWRTISYEFQTSPKQKYETIQLVIEEGQGLLEIGDVNLQ
jgi:hypothetical protein